MVTYYFVSLVLLLIIPSLFYALFRGAVDIWLRLRRISHTFIRKMKKGRKNFWWYESIHKTHNMGFLYSINRLFTIIYPSTVIFHILFGWIKIMTIPIFFLSCILYIFTAGMCLFSAIQNNLDFHGKAFVLFGKSLNGGVDSIVLDLIVSALPLICAYAQLILLSNIWHITLPILQFR